MRRISIFQQLSIYLIFLLPLNVSAQWLEWEDLTSTNLVLSTVANSDDEEKDFSVGDLDNDGNPDVIVVRKEPFSNQTQPPKSDLLLMNINGVLTDQTSLFAPEFLSNPTFARDVLIADLDGDNWLDVVVANTFEQQPIYYHNKGEDASGNWLGLEDETATRFPVLTGNDILFCAVWSGDVNGDAIDDIYFMNYRAQGASTIAEDFLLINDGNGIFTDESQARLGNFRNSAFGTSVEIHDVDNDGDNDIIKNSVLYSVPPWNQQGLFILYNDGTGNFPNTQKISISVTGGPDAAYMFRVEDYNLDGKLDFYVVDDVDDYQLTAGAITANSNINYVANIIGSTRTNSFGGNVHSADLDLDGDMDVAIADVDVDIPPCNSGREFAILENVNGLLVDTYTSNGNVWEENVYDYAFLDINGDGLTDMLNGLCNGYRLLLSDNCSLLTNNAADFDLDGISDACDPCPTNPDPNCTPDPSFPTVDQMYAVPRQWNELLLASIRRDFARPTVHARNLFHQSAMMWDVWATMHPENCHYLLGQTVDGFSCDFNGFTLNHNLVEEAIDTAISFASYKLLSHRFSNSPDATILQQAYDHHMTNVLGFDINFVSTDYSTGNSAALGNYIAECMIDFGLQDGSNEQNDYGNLSYNPVNTALVIDNPGNPTITDLNRWQPLTLDLFIDQSGNVIPGSTPGFLSPEWGQVSNFGLKDTDRTDYTRGGFTYEVYHDPGGPPLIGNGDRLGAQNYKWGFETVITWSSHLDATDGVMWDISPGVLGNSVALPGSINSYPSVYDQLQGGFSANGHNTNPTTGNSYNSNMVPRGDFARVLAEFWADGPDSETPPGHWFTLANEVTDHPALVRRLEGAGPVLSETEWYVKLYFALGGAMHDSAISAWGIKGWYDYIRPISAIRALADLGQATDPLLPSFNVDGINLIPGHIELVTIGDPLAGANNEHVDKIKILAWRGHDVINNVDTDEAGVDWILAENWVPYQRPSFVTPPFAGYVSGHSTFSRAAAEVLSLFTGDEFFPGGIGTFLAPQDEFLVFEDGPSVDVELQWATYRDAADQSALSRIWGGIHPPADDVPGRIIGIDVGINSYRKAKTYFHDLNQNGTADICEPCLPIQTIDFAHGATALIEWEASNYVEGDDLITNGADVTFDGGQSVRLHVGFEVKNGAQFLAKIEGCN